MLVHPLSAYDRYGVVVVTEPSRFLRELPETLYERWVLDETVDVSGPLSPRPRPPPPRRRPDPRPRRRRPRELGMGSGLDFLL